MAQRSDLFRQALTGVASGAVLALCLGLFLVLAGPVGAQTARPAELPPQGFAGQQYVDSTGCLFLRAGTPGKVLWLPRVSRQGKPLCGYPPSGQRVGVAEEGAPRVAPVESTAPARAAEAAVTAPGGFYVAVGSFGVAANVDKAVARLEALNFPAARRQVPGGSSALVTVLAGPFASAEVAARARAELRAAGFPDAIVLRP